MNFPHNHRLYAGNHWSDSPRDGLLEKADVTLVVDSDVPWIKSRFRPSPEALIYHIDADPLKVNMSLFNIGADISAQADAKTALEQINEWLTQQRITAEQEKADKIANVSSIHDAYVADVSALQATPQGDVITSHYALSVLKRHIDQRTLVLSEAISNYRPVCDVLERTVPGTYLTSGGTSLGWVGGAAIGAKLANPDKTVVAICGDGTFLFSIPSTVHWMARHYNAPFLTVIMNNRG